MIRVSDHLAFVQRVLNSYNIRSEWFEVTESVQAWCHKNGIVEDNPDRPAKCFLWPDKCFIVMQDTQTDAMIQSAKEHMNFSGFESDVRTLSNDAKYLLHLVLHEAACFVLQNTNQDVRDEWAFNEFAKHLTPEMERQV